MYLYTYKSFEKLILNDRHIYENVKVIFYRRLYSLKVIFGNSLGHRHPYIICSVDVRVK